MYEPIIDPMVFYWMDVLSKVQYIPLLLFWPVLISVSLTFVTYSKYNEEQSLPHKWSKRISLPLLIIFFISIPVALFIPSTETMYKMLIAKQVTPHTLQVTGETAEVIVDKISDKLINVIQEVKK